MGADAVSLVTAPRFGFTCSAPPQNVGGNEEPRRHQGQSGPLDRIGYLASNGRSDEDREYRNERGEERGPRRTEEHDGAAISQHQYHTCQTPLADRFQHAPPPAAKGPTPAAQPHKTPRHA